jgi:DNA-binding response OmpR family regulator
MPRILTIEDDAAVAEDIATELAHHGFVVDVESTAAGGLRRLDANRYDAITLDRLLPDADGLDVVKQLRAKRDTTPVLMISALSDLDERVRGLRAGGDDYLGKPFAPEELVARVEALVRRGQPAAVETALQYEALKMDLINRQVTFDGQALDLKPTEYRLLEYLLRHDGRILTREMILEQVWGYRFDPGTNAIEVHVARLRSRLQEVGAAQLIQTIRGRGYRLGHEA